jgi:hypothetical protein
VKVRYNMAVGIVFVVLGAVCELLGLWLVALGEFSPAAIFGFLPLLLGILYLVRPYFWVYAGSVEVVAAVGPARRQFPFQALELDGNRLVTVRADGTRKKVPVARWMANTGDWNTVMSSLPTPGDR